MNRYTLEVRWTEADEPNIFVVDAYDLDHMEERIDTMFSPSVLVALVGVDPNGACPTLETAA